jgi:S-adenosylmethionine:tRNA ribosyltransferase-isomerase
MDTADFSYHLPPELIAQEPARPRDSSRLLVLHRASGEIEHRTFHDLPEYLRASDVVVFNETLVIRARLHGQRPGGGKAEVLLLEEREPGLWEALVSPGRRLPPGREIAFPEFGLRAEILSRTTAGGRILRFHGPEEAIAGLAELGEMPLPPYITRPLTDARDYQTIYARLPGSSAAPTAGLHFTPEMLEQVRTRVQAVAQLSLHIGLATFRPIHTDRVEEHDMHTEKYHIPEVTAEAVSRALAEGRRVVAVGTTTVRALESAAAEDGRVRPGLGETDLFITPGYRFRVVGGLLTNFHLPRSTLLVLVSAFCGREQILRAYAEAVEQEYRFLSFGDAMLIV